MRRRQLIPKIMLPHRLMLWGIMLGGLGLILLLGRQAKAQPTFVASDYIFRITAQDCLFIPKSRVQTGFQVKGAAGIVTALHGVADCDTLQALNDNGEIVWEGLTIAGVDVARDVAVIAPTNGALLSGDEGLDIADNIEEDYASLLVIGYPGGRTRQAPSSRIQFIQKEPLSRFLSSDPPPTAFITRSSPQKDIDVLTLEADMVPGHSGAPLLTDDRTLLGIIDGGLRQGAIGQAWAIPWHDLDLQPLAGRQSEIQRLREQDPQLAFLFSTTLYSADAYGLVESNPVDDDTFAAFRHFFDVNDTKVVNGEEVLSHAIFEGVNNEPQGQRSLLASGDMFAAPDSTAPGRIGYFVIGDHSYALLGDLCVQSDTAALETQLDELYAGMRALIAFTSQGEPFGTLLGQDEVDGVPTNHYLVDSGSGEWAEGESYTIHRAELWTTIDGNYLVRMEFDFSYDGATLGAGRMRVSMMIHGLNTDPQVELPAVCTGAAALAPVPSPTLQRQRTTPTVTPTEVATPDATRTPARLSPLRPRATATPTPAGAAAVTEARAELVEVWLEHNQMEDGENGMLIHATFDVDGMRNRRLGITAFFKQDGELLRDTSGDYAAAGGEVATWDTLLPRRNITTYEDFTLFMPYRELDLAPGYYELTTVLRLWNFDNETILAESEPIPFTYTLPEPALTDTGAPTGTVEVGQIDHNVLENDLLGMRIHLRVNVLNLNGVDCQAVAYFEYAEGGNLQDFDETYQDAAGNVAATVDFAPLYDNTVYADMTLFMPYAQLHMAPGTYDLRFSVTLYDNATNTPFATSDFLGFTYTQEE